MRRLHRALVPLLVAALCSCTAAPPPQHELRLSLPLEPMSLSPLYAFAQDQIALDLLWCQTLVGLDEQNRSVPILVVRIPSRENGDVSADGLRITYHLRRNVHFADGVLFTSADVAFTFHAILDPANAAPTIDQYERVAGLTTPDDHTVVIRLRAPWSAAVRVLFAQADEAYGILPKHAFTSLRITGSAWDQQPFGTGPFRVAAWRRGDRIELVPNPYYAPRPKLARIVVRIVPNQVTAFNALRSHAVDAAELNPDNVGEAATMSGLRIARTAENGLGAIYLQTTAEPTNDIHVRRAIAYALDDHALSNAWRNEYPVARSVFPAPVVSWAQVPNAAYAHDLREAGRELDAAGWRLAGKIRTKRGVPLTLLCVTDASRPIFVRTAVIVQSQLAALGADVTIKTYTPALLAAPDGPQRSGRFSILPGRYIGGSDPEQSINLLCAEAHGGGSNYSRYCSARLEQLFGAQMHAHRTAERAADFVAMARLVRDEVPLIPLYDLLYIEGVDTRVLNYRRNMLRYPVHAELWDIQR
jgi:peptide/nickel transport system substrate-binding protein